MMENKSKEKGREKTSYPAIHFSRIEKLLKHEVIFYDYILYHNLWSHSTHQKKIGYEVTFP